MTLGSRVKPLGDSRAVGKSEELLANRGVALDVVDCISDVPEINALVLHRARASAVIR